jgi:hypothetical protein
VARTGTRGTPGSGDKPYANTYRPLDTRTNRREEPETLAARAALTDEHATGSPSNSSTAAWTSLARIGSSRSASTWTTAFSTQPGRRGRCRQATACRRGPPLARTAASFSARRPNDPCRSWFDRTPISSIFEEESGANRTNLVAAWPVCRGALRAQDHAARRPNGSVPLEGMADAATREPRRPT